MGETRPLRVAILGSTGSIGRQALDVCREHPEELEVVALGAHSSARRLLEQAAEFNVEHLALTAESGTAGTLDDLPAGTELVRGAHAMNELAERPDVDCVLQAMVGAAAIEPTLRALKAGKRVALANKECLVAAGSLIMGAAKPGQLLPVDSEHSAIYQCLRGEEGNEIREIWLTCSGGPFRGMDRDGLSRVSAAQALAHPTWSMGPKITVDSADLMNKGLEVIEATWLFGVDATRVKVLIHPESKIHSMVTFIDGSTKAQLAPPDMRGPISYALGYPQRLSLSGMDLDWREAGPLTFSAPDLKTFRCLALALEAARVGGTLPCAMNAANEVANAAFREGRIRLTDVDAVVEAVMEATTPEPARSLDQVLEVDRCAREAARLCVGELSS